MNEGHSVLDLGDMSMTPNYGPPSLEIFSGYGAWVKASGRNGVERSYLDCLCGLGVTGLGHCHPRVVEAIRDQAGKLGHISNLYANEPSVKLAQKLGALASPGPFRVFFANSGAEANEAAAKLARLWASKNFGPEKHTIIALTNGFHGRTFMAVSLTGQKKMQERFAPIVPGIRFANLNDIESLRAVVDDTVCAIIFEVIQAEGGVHVMSQEFYDEISRLAVKHQFLTIVDEVQTGIGRTGEMFCHHHYVNPSSLCGWPDIVTVAKAIGGGLPLSAMIAKSNIASELVAGSHASTFGGNPICCAAGLATLGVIEEYGLCHQVADWGEAFMADLRGSSSKIKNVRGRGFMIGIELHDGLTASAVVAKMQELWVLAGSAGPNVVRLLPPFVIRAEDLALAGEALRNALRML